ncbi:MAG: 2-C-methyl-D-erythritol 4-phosphate cytidylyltransferase [Ignavibacteria bacterium]|nr:2-C-methyl-D-erythritol 4-phosphate cytidylyltransferase [Ignavibacteria bacterium]
MNKNIAAVIMAAGQGKRMKNPDKSKVMHELKEKPLIKYVIDLSLEINSEK